MIFHKLIPFFVLMLDLVLLGSALAANGRSPRNRSFAFLTLALSVWTLGVLGLRWGEDPATALAWERFLHFGVVAIPVLFYDYVLVVLGERRWRPSLIAGYLIAAIFALLTPTPVLVAGVRMTPWGYAPAAGPAYGPFFAYFVGYTSLGVLVLVRAHANVTSTFRRNRLRLVLFGAVVSLLGGVVDFARFIFDLEWLYPLGVPASAVFALALGVAIIRYRLMSVSVLAKRAMLYALTWGAVASLLLVVLDVVDPILLSEASRVVGHADAIVLLGILVAALPLMRKLEDLLDRLMFHREHAISTALVALNREVSGIVDMERLAATLTAELTARIPVAHAALYVSAAHGEGFVALSRTARDEPGDVPADLPVSVGLWVRATGGTLAVDEIGWAAVGGALRLPMIEELERRHVALILPVLVDDDLAAILVVGEKLSGAIFESGEIELLEILAARVGTSLRNARLYRALAAQTAELRTARYLYGQTRDADQAKEQFLAMLTDELRDSVAPILNAAQVLHLIGTKDRRAEAMTALIGRQGQQLARLVDGLLDVSRIQLGQIRLRSEPVDIARLVGQSVGSVRASGKGHGRELRTSITPEPLLVTGDPARLEQVVWNLLDNALKYSPAGTAITVSVGRQDDVAVVRVEDQGVGLEPEMVPRIFELFTQVDTSLHRSEGGLGIGLALVRSLVEQHGGTVSASSAGLGRGSEFVVRLPLATTASGTAGDLSVSIAPGPCRRVLLVEDKADARESLMVLLELYGHEVRCAEDGRSGVEAALAWAPDVTLVDIGLPGIDGYEVARRVRSSPLGHGLCLVALTGHGEPEDRRRALESGFDEHLVKPVNGEDLRRVVEALGAFRAGQRGGTTT